MSTHIPPELIDDLMEVYVEWREECIVLRDAYERWADGPVADRELAFAAYLAALEREEQASAVYADCLYEIEHKPPEPVAPPSSLGDRVISRMSGLLGSVPMTADFKTVITMSHPAEPGRSVEGLADQENEMTEAQVLERRRWTALALLAVAQFVVVLDAAIVNVALPTIPTPAPPAPHGHEGRCHSTGGVGIRAASP